MRLVGRMRVKEVIVKDLLKDFMLNTLSHWGCHQQEARIHLGAVVHGLATNTEASGDISTVDVSPKTRREPWPRLRVVVAVAAKGLGLMGGINIPQAIWDNMSPENFRWAVEGTPPPSYRLRRIPLLGHLRPPMQQQYVVVSSSQRPPNERAYVRHNNTQHKAHSSFPC